MTDDQTWREWAEPFDLFVSYARRDDAAEPKMVSALVEQIEADFAAFSPADPLQVFFDKRAIRDMQDWRDRLQAGLRQSKFMLAVLSPAYFQSEWCRREWEEFLRVEQSRTYPGEATSPIFIVAPRELDKIVPPAARAWWDAVTARNPVVEIYPFWPNGRAALQEQIVRRRLALLGQAIRDRVQHGRLLARVPRKMKPRNPLFAGRRPELARLRDDLSKFDVAGVCAVSGIGGIGKSSVAREYAFRFRPEYLAGQFELDLSTVTTVDGVLAQLVEVARDYLGADIPPTLPEAVQFDRAVAKFDTLRPASGRC